MSPDTIIALGALFVAAISAIGTYRVSRRQTVIQEQVVGLQLKELKALEEGRATARLVCKSQKQTDFLILANAGGGAARKVRLELTCPDGQSAIPQAHLEIFPLDLLAPGEEISVMAQFRTGCMPPIWGSARWVDPDGTEREEDILVTEVQ